MFTFFLFHGERNVYGRMSVSGERYSVTLTLDDIPLTAIDRIERDIPNFALRALLLAFLIYVTYNENRKKRTPDV